MFEFLVCCFTKIYRNGTNALRIKTTTHRLMGIRPSTQVESVKDFLGDLLRSVLRTKTLEIHLLCRRRRRRGNPRRIMDNASDFRLYCFPPSRVSSRGLE